MNKILMVCGFAACLPLAALADDVKLEKELNGLDIETEVVGSGGVDAGPAPGGAGGVQVLRVTNNGDATAVCHLEPHPSETTVSNSTRAEIEPGGTATMQLEGSYSSATIRTKLVCEESS